MLQTAADIAMIFSPADFGRPASYAGPNGVTVSLARTLWRLGSTDGLQGRDNVQGAVAEAWIPLADLVDGNGDPVALEVGRLLTSYPGTAVAEAWKIAAPPVRAGERVVRVSLVRHGRPGGNR